MAESKITKVPKTGSLTVALDSIGRLTIPVGINRIQNVYIENGSYVAYPRYLNANESLGYVRNPNDFTPITNQPTVTVYYTYI